MFYHWQPPLSIALHRQVTGLELSRVFLMPRLAAVRLLARREDSPRAHLCSETLFETWVGGFASCGTGLRKCRGDDLLRLPCRGRAVAKRPPCTSSTLRVVAAGPAMASLLWPVQNMHSLCAGSAFRPSDSSACLVARGAAQVNPEVWGGRPRRRSGGVPSAPRSAERAASGRAFTQGKLRGGHP